METLYTLFRFFLDDSDLPYEPWECTELPDPHPPRSLLSRDEDALVDSDVMFCVLAIAFRKDNKGRVAGC